MSLTLSEYRKYDGLGLAELISAGEIQAHKLVEIAIKCIEEINPQYNAIINKMYDLARLQVNTIPTSSIFSGVPFLLKDLIVDYAGVVTSNGSELTKNLIPQFDSELVRRYKQAGLIILGKTNTPEFGLAPVTEPDLFGVTRNPWNVELTPGGSSGGSASAVATRMVPIAHANDGGGSIRIPAAYCGLFGLKPSRGRMPTGPVLGKLIQGLVVDHVLTRSVRDSAAILEATAGPDIGAPLYAPQPQISYLTATSTEPKFLRIGFTHKPFINVEVDSHYKNALTHTAKRCADLGHYVEEVSLDKLSIEDLYAVWVIFCGEIAATISELCQQNDIRLQMNKLETSTMLVYQFGRSLSAADFAKATHRLDSVARKVANYFMKYDVLLTPTMPFPPIKTGEFSDKGMHKFANEIIKHLPFRSLHKIFMKPEMLDQKYFKFIAFTLLFNITGQPAMSMPLEWDDNGLPIGCQFVSRYADEVTLFQLAGQLERVNPWVDRYQ